MLKTTKTYHSHRNQNTRRWFGRPWVNNDFYLVGVKKRRLGPITIVGHLGQTLVRALRCTIVHVFEIYTIGFGL
jgi:hypothetical protein